MDEPLREEKIRIEIHKSWLGPVAMGIGIFTMIAAINEMFKQSRGWGYDGTNALILGGVAAIFFAIGFYAIWCR